MPPVYVIDVCAIMDLYGFNQATALTQDPAARDIAWTNLMAMIEAGEVVTVYAAKNELERRARPCFFRLKPLFPKFVKRDSAQLIERAGDICSVFPSLVKRMDMLSSDREPADPYIIAYAEINDVTVITDELQKEDRSQNNKSGDRIPDVCDALGVEWLYLRDFAAIVNLLQPPSDC